MLVSQNRFNNNNDDNAVIYMTTYQLLTANTNYHTYYFIFLVI